MTTTNPLALASASDIKALVVACEVSATDALVRVDAVLARKSLTDGLVSASGLSVAT
jgi:hypothetical protein